MVSEFQNLTAHQESLISELQKLPKEWALTPVDGDKRPYRVGWQTESPLSTDKITAEIKSGKAKGFGLRTGITSGGLLAVDNDGNSAQEKMLELSGGEPLPDTVAYTSNRSGRYQQLFSVPQEYWGLIKTTKFKTGVIGDDGKPEQLELRWNGLQSVLPPSVHPMTGFYRWRKSPQEIDIAPAPMWLINLMMKEKEKPLPQPQQITTHYTTKARTGEKWSSEEYALSYLSALHPSRADDYDFWIAVGMALHSISDAFLYEWDKWSCQSSNYKPGDCEKKWKSFKRTGVSIGSLAHMAKEDGWRSPFEKQSGNGGSGNGGNGEQANGKKGNVINHPNFNPASGEELEAKLEEVIKKEVTGSKLSIQLNQLAAESGWHVSELRKLYFERKGETEEAEEQVDAQTLLPSLLEVHKLNLREYLVGDEGLLAEAMIKTAKAMPTSPEFLFTTLLSTAATTIGTSSRIIIKVEGKYKQPCIFTTAIVGRSGKIKTPAQSVIIDPLINLEIKANKQYQADLEQYEIELAKWKKKGADPAFKPKPPIQKRYITKDATIETLERIHGENPRGLLVYRDELAEEFKSNNAYRGGKGGDAEKKLDQWNGSAIIVDRKERQIMIERSAVSRTGSIQWDVLQSLMGDGRDDNGTFARCLFCAADAPPRLINLLNDEVDTGIDELLIHLYQRLEKMPERDYLLSIEAKRLFQKWQHSLVRAELNESNPGLQLVYPKIEAYTARFALWLHIVNAALAGETPQAVVSGQIMEAAIKLAKYYLEQAKLVITTNSPQSGLTGLVLKIQKYVEGKANGVKLYKLKSGIKALRNTALDTVMAHCKWLAEKGYGFLKGNAYFAKEVMTTNENESTPDCTVVSEKVDDHLMTDSCPEVINPNTSNRETSSDFNDFNDQNDYPSTTQSVTNLNQSAVFELCNGNSQNPIERVMTVIKDIKAGETLTEPGDDQKKQVVMNGHESHEADFVDDEADKTEQVLMEWQDEENLIEMRGYFSSCTNLIEYCQLLSVLTNKEAVEQVKASLNPEIQAQIKEWEAQLDNLKSSFQMGDRAYVKTQPHTDAMAPYVIEAIEGSNAKLDCFSNWISLSELRKE